VVTAHVPARRIDITGFGNHLEAVLAVEQQLKAPPYDLVIVSEHDPDWRCRRVQSLLDWLF